MSLNYVHLREFVVRPVLLHLGMHSQVAENLMIGTAAQESHGSHLKQLGGGPGVGIYQMEPFTHDDLWKTYLSRKPELAAKVRMLELPNWYEDDNAQEMAGNLYYATAMARIRYWRVSAPLPDFANDIEALAAYWKDYYNTQLGKGKTYEFVSNYPR